MALGQSEDLLYLIQVNNIFLIEQMEELKVQNSLLLQLVRGLQQQINSKNRQNQILFQQYDQLTNDYQQLQKTVDTLRTQNSQFKRQNMPNHENHSKLSYYQHQITQAKQKSLQYEQIIINLKRELQQKGGTIVFLENELKKPKQIEQNIGQTESLQPKIDELNTMLEMKEKSLIDLTQYMNIQAEKISELTREGIKAIENYEAKIQDKQNIIKQLNENLKKVQQSSKVLQQTKVEIKQDPSLNQETIPYQQKIQELNAQLRLKNQSIEELSQFMQTQAEKISKLQQQAQNRGNQIQNVQAVIKNKEQAISQLNQFLESILAQRRELQEKSAQIPNILEENQSLKIELNAMKVLQQERTQYVTLLQDKQEIQQEQANNEIQILRAKLSTNEDEIAHLKQIIEDRQFQLTTLRFQLDEKVLKVTEMQSLSEQNDVQFPSDNVNEQLRNDYKKSEKNIAQERQIQQVLLELLQKQQYIRNLQANKGEQNEKVQVQAIIKQQQTDLYIQKLQKRIEELTLQLAQYSLEPKQYNSKANNNGNIDAEKQNTEVSKLQQLIAQLQAIIESKSQNLAQLSEFMNQQSQQLDLLRGKVESALPNEGNNEEISEKNNKIAELQEILKSKQSSIAQLGEFLQEAYSKIATLQEEKKALPIPIQGDLEANALDSQLQEIEQLRNQINQLKEQKSRQQQQINTLKGQIFHRQQQINPLTSQLDKQNEQAKILQLSPQNHNAQRQSLLQKIKYLQETIVSKDQIISDFSQFMDDQAAQIAQLQDKIEINASNGIKIDEKPAMDQNKSHEYEQMKSILKTKQQSVNQLTEFLQQSYNKNAVLQQTIESLQQEIKTLKQGLTQQEQGVKQGQNIQQQDKIQQENNMEGQQSLKQVKIDQLLIHETQQAQLLAANQQILQKLTLQISKLQQNKNTLQSQCQHLQNLKAQFTESLNTLSEAFQKYTNHANESTQNPTKPAQSIQPNDINTNDNKSPQLEKKLQEYQQQLNQKQQELDSMMQVLQNLQNEIRNKDDIIEQLQSNKQTMTDLDKGQEIQKDLIIKELKQQLQNFKLSMQSQRNKQNQPQQLMQQYERLGFEYQDLQSTSKQLQRQYKNQLKEMNSQNALQRQLGQLAQAEQFNQQQGEIEQNEQQLTLLQAIQQIVLYSQNQGSNQRIYSYIKAIKAAYQKQTEIFQTQIKQLTDALNSLVEVNNTLTEQLQNTTIQAQQANKYLLEKQAQYTEIVQKCQHLQLEHLQQIKNMRRSASSLKEQINSKPQNTKLIIQKLEDEILTLRTENIKKQSQLQQLREHKNKKFVKELNNLLDSYTVNKEGQEQREIKDVEQQLEKIAFERDELKRRCFSYEGQITELQKQYTQLSNQLENFHKNSVKDATPIHQQAENSAHMDSLHLADHEGKLLNGLEQPLRLNGIGRGESSHSCTEAQGTQRLRVAYEQLYAQLNEKNGAILELQETMIKVEKGYNNQIMNLRKIIAQLNNDSILLRKNLYQANPDAIDIGELIKDTFSSSQKDTQFYKPNLPLYSQSLLNIQQNHNNSYYSQAYRGGQRPKRRYQPYYNAMNMGQRFMGRRCKQQNPFTAHLQLQQSRFRGHHSSIKYDRRY